MHIFGQSEKGPCTSLSTWPKYLNVLIYANWGGLMVKTNFDSEEGSLSNWGSPAGWWGLLVMLSASSELEKLGRPNCIAWIGPRQWIVSSQPAVLRPTKARQAQRKCATAAHSLRYQPQQTLVRRLRRGDNNRRKRRTEGGKRGAFGGKGGSGSRGAFQVTFRFSSLKPSLSNF